MEMMTLHKWLSLNELIFKTYFFIFRSDSNYNEAGQQPGEISQFSFVYKGQFKLGEVSLGLVG
jgi:hypothetical protein